MKLDRAALLALLLTTFVASGCAKKPPRDVPPPPATGAEDPQVAGPLDGMAALKADFLAKAGSDTVYFDTDSNMLDARSRQTLDAQAAWLLTHPQIQVTIEGHCDERGTREYNLALGERRATSAKNYLAARGVAEIRMRTISWGKERPADIGSDASAWARNRRAVTVLPSE